MPTPPVRTDLSFPTTAVALAGGLGTRLRPVLPDRPKVLAPAAERPFLDYVLSYLKQQGMQRVILSIGYLARQVQDFAGDGRPWGLAIEYREEPEPLGTGGALRLASEGLAEPFFALNADTLFLVELPDLWAFHIKTQALATLALLSTADPAARGNVILSEDGHVLAFEEKPAVRLVGETALVSGGVYVLSPGALEIVSPGEAVSLERQVFPTLARRGELAGLALPGYFTDIGTPESLAAFERDVNRGVIGL